jgi:Transposase DDE domain
VCACAPLRHWRGSSRAFLYTAVWCQLFDEQRQTWTKAHLIVATESGLDAPTIVQLYARRWGIEPLVHNLKRRWGLTISGNTRAPCSSCGSRSARAHGA